MIFDIDQEFIDAIETAQSKYNPIRWLVAYSGGSDSAVALQQAIHTGMYKKYSMGVMTIDTGIASVGHLERVYSDIMTATGQYPLTYTGEGFEWYVQNVSEYGFGYVPSQHSVYYRMLKERAIMTCVRDLKQHRMDKIACITGVRRIESARRANRPIIQKNGARISVNAIATYTDNDKENVLKNADWFSGKTTHDCLCNWTRKYTLDDVPKNQRNELIEVSCELRKIGMWGYGERVTESWMADNGKSTDMPDDSFCVNCIQKQLL